MVWLMVTLFIIDTRSILLSLLSMLPFMLLTYFHSAFIGITDIYLTLYCSCSNGLILLSAQFLLSSGARILETKSTKITKISSKRFNYCDTAKFQYLLAASKTTCYNVSRSQDLNNSSVL